MKSLLDKLYQYQTIFFSQSSIQSDWAVPIDPTYTEYPPSFQSDSSVDTFYAYSTDLSVDPTIPVAAANPSNYRALPYAAAIDDPSIASTISFGFAPSNPTSYEDPGTFLFHPNINQDDLYGAAAGYPRPYKSASADPRSYQGSPYGAASGYSGIYQVLSYGTAPSYEIFPYEAAPFDPSVFEGPPADPSITSTLDVAPPAVPSNYEAPPYWAAPFHPILHRSLQYGSTFADRSIGPSVPASATDTANPNTKQKLLHVSATADSGIRARVPATASVPGADPTVPYVAVPS